MDAQQKAIARKALRAAISLAGSQEKFAHGVEATQQAVSVWLKKGCIPAEKVVLAEQAVNAAIKRHEFRPDIFSQPSQQG